MTDGTLRAQLLVPVQLLPGADSRKRLNKLTTKSELNGLVGDSTHRPFLQFLCKLRDEDILRLNAKKLNRVINDRLGHTRHLISLREIGKLCCLDNSRNNVWTRRRKFVSQADGLGTECSGGCHKDLDVDWSVKSCNCRQTLFF